MKKVLITGGSGFIGSHLIPKLLQMGVEINILDNFCTGKIENLIPYTNDINIKVGDINNYDDVLESMIGCDYVLLIETQSRAWAMRTQIRTPCACPALFSKWHPLYVLMEEGRPS